MSILCLFSFQFLFLFLLLLDHSKKGSIFGLNKRDFRELSEMALARCLPYLSSGISVVLNKSVYLSYYSGDEIRPAPDHSID